MNWKHTLTPLFVCGIMFSGQASASFYIDNQGLEDEDARSPITDLKGAPNGFRVLSDNSYSSIHQIGKGKAVKISGFGVELSLNEVMSMVMPNKWISYIDEEITPNGLFEWNSSNEEWIKSLAVIGATYGYKFIVDWDQKMIQVSQREGFIEPNYDHPIEMQDEATGRSIFVYSGKPIDKEGVILVDGKVVKVKISK
jgi:hypothetical protein